MEFQSLQSDKAEMLSYSKSFSLFLLFLYFRTRILTLLHHHGNGLWNTLFIKLLGLTFYLLNTSQMMATSYSLLTCLTCIKFLRDVEQVVICIDLYTCCFLFYLIDNKISAEGGRCLLSYQYDIKHVFSFNLSKNKEIF